MVTIALKTLVFDSPERLITISDIRSTLLISLLADLVTLAVLRCRGRMSIIEGATLWRLFSTRASLRHAAPDEAAACRLRTANSAPTSRSTGVYE